MAIGYIFENNRTQSVRLPDEARFSTEVKNVMVRVVGQDRILSPLNRAWDSFFQSDAAVTDDFMEEHSTQKQT